jgi:hypothetical protein
VALSIQLHPRWTIPPGGASFSGTLLACAAAKEPCPHLLFYSHLVQARR